MRFYVLSVAFLGMWKKMKRSYDQYLNCSNAKFSPNWFTSTINISTTGLWQRRMTSENLIETVSTCIFSPFKHQSIDWTDNANWMIRNVAYKMTAILFGHQYLDYRICCQSLSTFQMLFPMGLVPDTQKYGCACTRNAGNVFPLTAGKRSRHTSRHVRHARAVVHAGIAN